MVYAMSRFADELCQDPGPGQALLWGWMSQGQLFTLPILTAGVVLACWRGAAAGHAGDQPL